MLCHFLNCLLYWHRVRIWGIMCTVQQSKMFTSALESLPQFIIETDADWCMVYDFMESQCGDLKDYHWEDVAEVYKEFNNDLRY